MKKILSTSYLLLLLVMLYAPIVIIAIFSFTESKVLGNWTGFSTELYASLFSGGVRYSLLDAIKNTFIIAITAATVSTLLGTVAAIGINDLRYGKRRAINFVNNIPILNPDIITGISLFLLFVSLGITQGYTTVILAHIAFCAPYVVLSVMPRLTQMNPNIYATPSYLRLFSLMSFAGAQTFSLYQGLHTRQPLGSIRTVMLEAMK